jgi:hypothetical protein
MLVIASDGVSLAKRWASGVTAQAPATRVDISGRRWSDRPLQGLLLAGQF